MSSASNARVAVLSDVHANPWALRAVLAEVRTADVDLIVNCGDLVAGPWPNAVVDALYSVGVPVLSVRGNGDRLVADAYDGHWDDMPASAHPMLAWAAAHLTEDERRLVGAMPLTARIEVAGLGPVTFFHATPASDEQILLPTTPDPEITEALARVDTAVAVAGHTHLPDDRIVGTRRVLNAGSVGKPFDPPEAAWLLLGPGVELRRTGYDIGAALEAARRELSGSAQHGAVVAKDFADSLRPPGREHVLRAFGPAQAAQVGHLAARSRLPTLDH